MAAATRTEEDLLGQREIPADAYWGIHTLRAMENFQISSTRVHDLPDLVRGIFPVVATISAFYAFVSSASGEFRFVFESDLTGDASVQKRLWQVNEEIADLIAEVIEADTALPREQSKLLAISLVGNAQVSARYWVSSGMTIPVEEATSLVSRLAWRGIRGFPLTGYDPARLH